MAVTAQVTQPPPETPSITQQFYDLPKVVRNSIVLGLAGAAISVITSLITISNPVTGAICGGLYVACSNGFTELIIPGMEKEIIKCMGSAEKTHVAFFSYLAVCTLCMIAFSVNPINAAFLTLTTLPLSYAVDLVVDLVFQK